MGDIPDFNSPASAEIWNMLYKLPRSGNYKLSLLNK